ncbi:MAG: alpha/beta hydrolase [Pseudomonadota bacterium]
MTIATATTSPHRPRLDPVPRTAVPDGGETRFVAADDAAQLRLVDWVPAGEIRAHAIMAGGKRDFIERHAESYHRLLGAGVAITAFDWRDQGLSARESVADHLLFDRMETDFDTIFGAAPAHAVPRILVGHSMGGHMMLRALANRPHLRADVHSAIFFAPMLGIGGGPPPWLLGGLARLHVALGRGRHYPPGQLPYGPDYKSEARRERLTGDRARFDEGFEFIEAEPGLAAGGATWGWLAGAHESMAALREPGVLEAVGTPVSIFVGTREMVVSADAIVDAAHRLPHANLKVIDDGRHELQLDSDPVQARLWPHVMAALP